MQEGDHLDFDPFHFEVVLIPGHTPGSIALWEKEQRFLISGDSVSNATTFLFGEGRGLPAYLKQFAETGRHCGSARCHLWIAWSPRGADGADQELIELAEQVAQGADCGHTG